MRHWHCSQDETVYKNPVLGVKHRGPSWFDTRHLNIKAKPNAVAYSEARRIAVDNRMFSGADEKLRVEAELKQKEHLEAVRIHKIKEAGPELYAALQQVIAVIENVAKDHPDELWLGSEYRQAKEAIAKAEA